jgi:N-acetylneuraminic acid mutarotase
MATNGKDFVIVFGGNTTDDDGEPVPLNDMYQLSVQDPRPQWRQVKQTGDLPCKRAGFSFNFMASNSQFYLFGGSDDKKPVEFNDLYAFDPTSFQWKKVATGGTPPGPRLNHAAAVIASSLYVFGGYQEGEARADLFRFDTRLSKWTSLSPPSPPTARCNHTLTAVNDKLFLIGGRANENIVFNDVHVYDTVSNTWSTPTIRSNPPEARDFHSTVLLGDEKTLLVFGGAHDIESKNVSLHFNDVHLFNTETFTWSQPSVSGPPPPPRWMHRAIVCHGVKMYVFAGTDEEDYDDLHLLQFELSNNDNPTPAVRAPPRRNAAPSSSTSSASATPTASSSAAAPTAPTRKAPEPVDDSAVSTPTQPASVSKTGSSSKMETTTTPTPTTGPSLSFTTPTSVPAARKTVAPAKVGGVGLRNFDDRKTEVVNVVDVIFKQLQQEFQKLDVAKAELQNERTAFEEERHENEATYAKQQQELRQQLDKHKKETEEWLAARKAEIDAQKTQLAAEKAKLLKDQAKLAADTESLEGKVTAFEESRRQMEAIMNKIKGIA